MVLAGLLGRTASTAGLQATGGVGAYDVLQSAGLLFFAFAGYARIATLGEEVRDPERTIPLALGAVLAVYAAVAVSALLAVGPAALAASGARWPTFVGAGSLSALTPAVRVGGAVAALGVLLSLLVGVSRTTLAVVVLVLVVDLRGAIGFSSFAVLVYYAVTNASALTLRPDQRRYPPVVAVAGLLGCLLLAATLPLASVLTGAAVLGVGALAYALRG